jgi:hypothetical protein
VIEIKASRTESTVAGLRKEERTMTKLLGKGGLRRVLSLAKSKRNYLADLGANSESGLLKLSEHRTWLRLAFVIGLIATALVWIVALEFPSAVSNIYANGINSNLLPQRYSTLLSVLLMSIPFAPPFVSSFALGYLIFPSSPQPNVAAGVMSTFEYRQKSNRRWVIVVAAGMFGALNCLFLLVAVSSATGY